MSSHHHIRLHALQVHYRGSDDGFDARRQAGNWQQDVWLPMLEKVLDQYDVPGQVITIPKINLVVVSGNKAWGTELAEAAIRQIEEQLGKQISNLPAAGSAHTTIAGREVELFIYYLRRGHLPWWTWIKGAQQWEAWLRTFFRQLDNRKASCIAAAISEGRARTRLIQNLEPEEFWSLVQLLAERDELVAVWKTDWDRIQHAGNHPGSIGLLASQYWNTLLFTLSHQPGRASVNELFCAALVRTIPGVRRIADMGRLCNNALREAFTMLPTLQPEKPEPLHAEREDPEDTAHPLYIYGAGLVIAAPFLIDLFRNLKLLDVDKTITDPTKAIALVNYLATGEINAPETELVMQKVLCGAHVDTPVCIKDTQLSAAECAEADALLQSIIEHWPALKNTSPNGLRANFLQREGRLQRNDSGWQLKVQQESYDLLLSFLPWSFSYIKLPWMETLLQVEWN